MESLFRRTLSAGLIDDFLHHGDRLSRSLEKLRVWFERKGSAVLAMQVAGHGRHQRNDLLVRFDTETGLLSFAVATETRDFGRTVRTWRATKPKAKDRGIDPQIGAWVNLAHAAAGDHELRGLLSALNWVD